MEWGVERKSVLNDNEVNASRSKCGKSYLTFTCWWLDFIIIISSSRNSSIISSISIEPTYSYESHLSTRKSLFVFDLRGTSRFLRILNNFSLNVKNIINIERCNNL